VQHDPLGGQFQIGIIREGEFAVDGTAKMLTTTNTGMNEKSRNERFLLLIASTSRTQ
jgi:hypothetical protein